MAAVLNPLVDCDWGWDRAFILSLKLAVFTTLSRNVFPSAITPLYCPMSSSAGLREAYSRSIETRPLFEDASTAETIGDGANAD